MLPISTRRATIDDLDAVIADVQAGFDSYVDFAPLGWAPPDMAVEGDRIGETLIDEDTWALLALAGRAPVGHIALTPARRRTAGQAWATKSALIPGLAHLWQLFVLPDWWGRGVAPILHEAAVAEVSRREYEGLRLYTPSLHARARRFYERRGWEVTGEEWNADLALMLTEYRLALA